MNAPITRIMIGFFMLLSATCSAPYRIIQTLVPATPSPVPVQPTETGLPEEQATPTQQESTVTPSPRPSAAAAAASTATLDVGTFSSGAACTYHPATAQMLAQTSQEQWIDWVEKLSGAEPVTIDGDETVIETRYSLSMFNGQENARAFEWLQQQVEQWYPAEQIEVQPFEVEFEDRRLTWNNLIITIPGRRNADEIVVLSAHLDSTSSQPTRLAPGAEDNASGAATLIEAARLFREARFERTLQIVWFTGEEQGLFGSQAYVKAARANRQRIIGAINLDMFGYDSDDDRCFELHVGTLPDSQVIGQCFQTSIESYQLDLKADYLTSEAIDRSDHGSFWEAGLGAVEVLENLFDNKQPNGCANRDPSPHYHTNQDVVTNLNPVTSFSIAKASLAAAAGMAQPAVP